MVAAVGDAVRFMETISGESLHNLNRADFYTSHEALLLPYEEAMTRQVPRQWGWFNLSTHFPWIGMRTADARWRARRVFSRAAQSGGGEDRPLGDSSDQLLQLADVLNPENEPGRLTFIQRMGAAKVEEKLPALVQAVQREGRRVLWICDPMHGNTESHVEWLQDPSLRQHPEPSWTAASISTPRWVRDWVACISS